MTRSRSHLAGPTHNRSRISILLLAAQHVKGGFGQMPRHRAHCGVVSFAPMQPRIQFTHVPFRASFVITATEFAASENAHFNTDSRPALCPSHLAHRWRAPAASFPHNWPVAPRSETALHPRFPMQSWPPGSPPLPERFQPLHLRRFLDHLFQAVFDSPIWACRASSCISICRVAQGSAPAIAPSAARVLPALSFRRDRCTHSAASPTSPASP